MTEAWILLLLTAILVALGACSNLDTYRNDGKNHDIRIGYTWHI